MSIKFQWKIYYMHLPHRVHKIDDKIEIDDGKCILRWFMMFLYTAKWHSCWWLKLQKRKTDVLNYTTRAGVNSEVMCNIALLANTNTHIHTGRLHFNRVHSHHIHVCACASHHTYISDLWVHSFSLTVHVPQAEMHLMEEKLCTLKNILNRAKDFLFHSSWKVIQLNEMLSNREKNAYTHRTGITELVIHWW